jgi:hypothetical protein
MFPVFLHRSLITQITLFEISFLRTTSENASDIWHIMELTMASSGMLRRVALVRTDVSEELSASFIRVTRIGEL